MKKKEILPFVMAMDGLFEVIMLMKCQEKTIIPQYHLCE